MIRWDFPEGSASILATRAVASVSALRPAATGCRGFAGTGWRAWPSGLARPVPAPGRTPGKSRRRSISKSERRREQAAAARSRNERQPPSGCGTAVSEQVQRMSLVYTTAPGLERDASLCYLGTVGGTLRIGPDSVLRPSPLSTVNLSAWHQIKTRCGNHTAL